jgi:hypothetical protein
MKGFACGFKPEDLPCVRSELSEAGFVRQAEIYTWPTDRRVVDKTAMQLNDAKGSGVPWSVAGGFGGDR